MNKKALYSIICLLIIATFIISCKGSSHMEDDLSFPNFKKAAKFDAAIYNEIYNTFDEIHKEIFIENYNKNNNVLNYSDMEMGKYYGRFLFIRREAVKEGAKFNNEAVIYNYINSSKSLIPEEYEVVFNNFMEDNNLSEEEAIELYLMPYSLLEQYNSFYQRYYLDNIFMGEIRDSETIQKEYPWMNENEVLKVIYKDYNKFEESYEEYIDKLMDES